MKLTIFSPKAGTSFYIDREYRKNVLDPRRHWCWFLNDFHQRFTDEDIAKMPKNSFAVHLGEEELFVVVKFEDGRHCRYPVSLIEKFIEDFSSAEGLKAGIEKFVETAEVRAEIQLINSGIAKDPNLPPSMKNSYFGCEKANLRFTGILNPIRELEESYFAKGSLDRGLLNTAISAVYDQYIKLKKQLESGDCVPAHGTNSHLSEIVPVMRNIYTRLLHLRDNPSDVDAFEVALVMENGLFFTYYNYALKNPARYEEVRQKIMTASLREQANSVALELISQGQFEKAQEILKQKAPMKPVNIVMPKAGSFVLSQFARRELAEELQKASVFIRELVGQQPTVSDTTKMPNHTIVFYAGDDALYAQVKFEDGRHSRFSVRLIEKFIQDFSSREGVIKGINLFVETLYKRPSIELVSWGTFVDPDILACLGKKSCNERRELFFTGVNKVIYDVEEKYFVTGSLDQSLLDEAIYRVFNKLVNLKRELLARGDYTPNYTDSPISSIVLVLERVLKRLEYIKANPADVDAFEVQLLPQQPNHTHCERACKNPARYEEVRLKIAAAFTKFKLEEKQEEARLAEVERKRQKELQELREKVAKQEALSAAQEELIAVALDYKRQQEAREGQVKQKAAMNYAEPPVKAAEDMKVDVVEDDGCYHIEIPEGCSDALREQLEWMNKIKTTKRNRLYKAAIQDLEENVDDDDDDQLCSELSMTIPDCPVYLGGHLYDLAELLELLKKGNGEATRPYCHDRKFTIKDISPAIPVQQKINKLIEKFNRKAAEQQASVVPNSVFKPRAPTSEASLLVVEERSSNDVSTNMALDN